MDDPRLGECQGWVIYGEILSRGESSAIIKQAWGLELADMKWDAKELDICHEVIPGEVVNVPLADIRLVELDALPELKDPGPVVYPVDGSWAFLCVPSDWTDAQAVEFTAGKYPEFKTMTGKRWQGFPCPRFPHKQHITLDYFNR